MEKQGNFVDGSRRKGSSDGYSSGSYKGYFDTDEEYDIAGWIQEQLKFAAVSVMRKRDYKIVRPLITGIPIMQ